MKNEMVTIALHTGKKEYYPLIENFLKSFLICNTYPNIELLLIESAGNQDIRAWFSSLNFENNFINFDGTVTSVKKNKNVEIKKSLLNIDLDPKLRWNIHFTNAWKEAIAAAKGKYFVLFAEDNQFNIEGDIIDDYIAVLKNNTKSLVHFMAQQKYKYYKNNNRIAETIEINNSKFFRAEETKWCFFGLTDIANYDDIGELKINFNNEEITSENYYKLHTTMQDYTDRAKEKGYQRFYPSIPHGVWFYNDDRPAIIKKINDATKENPDYVYYKIFKKSVLTNQIIDASFPIAIDYYKNQINNK